MIPCPISQAKAALNSVFCTASGCKSDLAILAHQGAHFCYHERSSLDGHSFSHRLWANTLFVLYQMSSEPHRFQVIKYLYGSAHPLKALTFAFEK
jgi:hypothetical protein